MAKIVGYYPSATAGFGQSPLDALTGGLTAGIGSEIRRQIDESVNEKMLIGGIAMAVGFAALGALIFIRTER